jgi:hypothetical protein
MAQTDSFLPTLDDEDLLGVAIYQGAVYTLLGVLVDFMPDYQAYDPEGSATEEAREFREGVLTLSVEAAPRFLRALNAKLLTRDQAEFLASKTDEPELTFFVDFDSRRFVHSYFDLAFEDYCPRGWKCLLGRPQEELTKVLRASRV